MVPPCRGSIRALILRAPQVILQAIVPLPLIEFRGQSLSTGYFYLGFPLELFSGLLEQLTTLCRPCRLLTRIQSLTVMTVSSLDLLWLPW
jgi:hypothetical protein